MNNRKIVIFCPLINEIGLAERFSGSIVLFRDKNNTLRASAFHVIVGTL